MILEPIIIGRRSVLGDYRMRIVFRGAKERFTRRAITVAVEAVRVNAGASRGKEEVLCVPPQGKVAAVPVSACRVERQSCVGWQDWRGPRGSNRNGGRRWC